MMRQYLRARLPIERAMNFRPDLPPSLHPRMQTHLTEVSPDEWYFAAPYVILMNKNAPQHRYELREIFDALH
jgi:hypothetical protein